MNFNWLLAAGFCLGMVCLPSCEESKDAMDVEEEKYLFFLHNRFLEEHSVDDLHPDFGRVEYPEIVDKFSSAGFTVISEQRRGNVNARAYALNVKSQIDSLFALGVRPASINALFGGCLIKADQAGKGSLTDANVSEWPKTVAKVKQHYTGKIAYLVPGYGRPGGVELLDYTIDLFSEAGKE